MPSEMRPVRSIVYRYLTNADFYNMYKPHGSEAGGGGQTYIDFPTQDVSVAQWERFLAGVAGVVVERRTQGHSWNVPINSIGLGQAQQMVRIYRRRPQSVSVANQTLDRPQTNRVEAWHPRRGFPAPANPRNRRQCPPGLAVFLARAMDNTVWAGWFLNSDLARSPAHPNVQTELRGLLSVPSSNRHRAGVIELNGPTVWVDENNMVQPFHPPHVEEPPHLRALSRESPQEPTSREPRSRGEEHGQRQRVRATDAQGHQLDAVRRSVVEKYAMDRAKEAYPGAEDTSHAESFDLRTHEGGREVRVEVKGTLGAGEYILVTANEIENARASEWRTDLFVVSDIELTRLGSEFVASRGRTRVIRGWVPSMDDLTPTQYRYRLPR